MGILSTTVFFGCFRKTSKLRCWATHKILLIVYFDTVESAVFYLILSAKIHPQGRSVEAIINPSILLNFQIALRFFAHQRTSKDVPQSCRKGHNRLIFTHSGCRHPPPQEKSVKNCDHDCMKNKKNYLISLIIFSMKFFFFALFCENISYW